MEATQTDKGITFIYSYYDNPEMFKIHQRSWMTLPKDILKRVEFIVTDDCSPNLPAKDAVILPMDFPFRLYRVKVDIPWNWRTCRNIGVYEAIPGGWIFITDIDLLAPNDTIQKLLKLIDKNEVDKKHFYTFDRVIAPDMRPYKNHPNTYFMHRELYLIIGGYDECVSGYYGLDGVFRRRLERGSRGAVHLDGCKIILHQRDHYPDASVSNMPRKENRNTEEVQQARMLLKHRFQNNIRPDVCTFPYERIL